MTSGTESRVPAGMTISWPLRVLWGTRLPHRAQVQMPKLAADIKSNLRTSSAPDSHENCAGAT